MILIAEQDWRQASQAHTVSMNKCCALTSWKMLSWWQHTVWLSKICINGIFTHMEVKMSQALMQPYTITESVDYFKWPIFLSTCGYIHHSSMMDSHAMSLRVKRSHTFNSGFHRWLIWNLDFPRVSEAFQNMIYCEW